MIQDWKYLRYLRYLYGVKAWQSARCEPFIKESQKYLKTHRVSSLQQRSEKVIQGSLSLYWYNTVVFLEKRKPGSDTPISAIHQGGGMQTVASRPPSGPQQLQQLAAHCSCCHSLCQTDTLLPQVFGENWNAFRQYIKDRFFFSHSWVLLSSQFHSPRSQECNAEISQVFFVIWIELTHFYDDYQFLIKSFCVNCQKKNIERKITL